MGVVDIIVIVCVSVAFAAAVGYFVWRKVKHKGGCDCGCDCGCNCGYNCGGSASCNCCNKGADSGNKEDNAR